MITHEEQQKIWDEEHRNPHVLKQMDSNEGSSGVVKFWEFLKNKGHNLKGLEMGCGKGRNVIWLAMQGLQMDGFDFSPFAINEAIQRSKNKNVESFVNFKVQDATLPWQYDSNYFDFGIDCFASTDIESQSGRKFAIKEFLRVIKPGGYLLAYLLSMDDEFHKEMIAKFGADEKHTFLHPSNGKFEKAFDENEIKELYKDFKIIKNERLNKTAEFFDKQYSCQHFWLILQKPN